MPKRGTDGRHGFESRQPKKKSVLCFILQTNFAARRTFVRLRANKIKSESDIINDLGLDSLDIVELVMTLEEKWNIVADDEDIKTLKTVADVVKYIENNAK